MATRESASPHLEREIEFEWTLLSYHYGFSFEEIAHMPRWARKKYLRALSRILAQEKISAIEVTAYPYMKPGPQKSMMRKLSRRAQAGLPKNITRPKSHEDAKKGLAVLGVGVEIEDA